jgi:hypothetical protein
MSEAELLQRIEDLEVAVSQLLSMAQDSAEKYQRTIPVVLALKDSFDGLMTAAAIGMKPGAVVAFVREHVATAAASRAGRVANAQAVARRADMIVLPGGKVGA